MNTNLLCVVTFGALFGFTACGGKVTFQEGGGGDGGTGNAGNSGNAGNTGGVGNAGGGTTSTSTNGGGPSTTGTGGGTSLQVACNEFCEETGDCFLPPPCVQDCVGATDPDCSKEFVDLLECISDGFNPNGCQTDNFCEFEGSVWDQCQNGGGDCVTQECYGGPMGECGCYGECVGNFYETQCFGGPNGSCDCYANGNYAGSCGSSPGPDNCDPFAGCCGDVFFAIEG